MGGNNKFIDKFSNVAMRVGGQIHLKALRDTFATIMPLYILAGVAVLINNVVLPFILKGNALVNAQYWGTVITNGTLNISGLLVAPIVAYMLSQSKRFENPLAAAIIALSSLIVMMPNVLEVTPVGAEKGVQVSGILGFSNIGTTGLFAGIIIGLITCELFITISHIDKLQIKLGDNIPPAVANSFNVLIPVILVLAFWGIISTVLFVCFDTNLVALISKFIQEPLRKVNTSLFRSYLLIQLRKLPIYTWHSSDSYLRNITRTITNCKYQRKHACLCKSSYNSTYHERSICTYIWNDRWIRKYDRITDRYILIQ